MRPFPPVAREQCGAFTAAQAYAAGWTFEALRNAVHHGRIERLTRGIYAGVDTAGDVHVVERRTAATRSAAALLSTRRAIVSHRSAAALARLVGCEVPEPVLPANIHAADGRRLARTDCYWDEYGVVGEADGLEKYDSPAKLRSEKLRHERLEQCGLVVVRWGWRELSDMPALVSRLGRAFDRGDSDRRWTWRPSCKVL